MTIIRSVNIKQILNNYELGEDGVILEMNKYKCIANCQFQFYFDSLILIQYIINSLQNNLIFINKDNIGFAFEKSKVSSARDNKFNTVRDFT